MKLEVYMPIETCRESNGGFGTTRGAMLARSARRANQRGSAKIAVLAELRRKRLEGLRPKTVRLIRVARGRMDGDGLQAALKSVRDGVADALGCDDSDRSGVVWLYDQERSKGSQRGVRAVLDWNPTGCPRCGYGAEDRA